MSDNTVTILTDKTAPAPSRSRWYNDSIRRVGGICRRPHYVNAEAQPLYLDPDQVGTIDRTDAARAAISRDNLPDVGARVILSGDIVDGLLTNVLRASKPTAATFATPERPTSPDSLRIIVSNESAASPFGVLAWAARRNINDCPPPYLIPLIYECDHGGLVVPTETDLIARLIAYETGPDLADETALARPSETANDWANEQALEIVKGWADERESGWFLPADLFLDLRVFLEVAIRAGVMPPRPMLTEDGEIMFYGRRGSAYLDLGLEGDGTYSYFCRDSDGKEAFSEANLPISDGIPPHIQKVIREITS